MNASILALIVGLVLILLGLINIFAKVLAWKLPEWQNRNRASQPKRTAEWEKATTTSGLGLLIVGIIIGGLGLAALTMTNGL
jgi:hypothetical protein